MNTVAGLILAGSRPGVSDPLAAGAGVAHKALIPFGGETMLARVAHALSAAGIGPIAVSADHPQVIAEAGRLGLRVLPTGTGPSASVAAAMRALSLPLVVTTADHALLQPGWVIDFLADTPAAADVAVLLARRDLIEAAAPATRRTYLRFADGDWSGCNLFLLRTAGAEAAIALWQEVEADRKRPWRIVGRFGAVTLVRYLLRRLTLVAAVRRLGGLAGVEAAAVPARDGRAAIDVDKPADIDLVRSLIGDTQPLSVLHNQKGS